MIAAKTRFVKTKKPDKSGFLLCKRGILPELLISKSNISAKHNMIIQWNMSLIYNYIVKI